MTDPFARFGAALVRFRWLVLLGWLVVLGVAAGLLATKASEVVKGGGFQDDNSESIKAARVLADEFNAAPGNTVIIVYRSPDRTVDDPTYRDAVTRGAEALQTVHGVRAVLTFFNTGDPSFNSQDRRTTLGLVSIEGDKGDAQETVPDLRERLDALQLPIEHYATGFPAIDYDTFVTSEEDLRRSEVFTIPIILILLLLVFRTVIASAIPMVLGAFSVLLAIAAIYLIGSAIDTSIFALNVASMIGLGLSIDFSLIMISRFREERAAGRDTRDAVAITLATAGRSIFYSGVTVLLAMGVLTLLLARLMIVRSISLAVMVVAFTSLLAGLTLLPAILGILGHRIEWLRVMPRPKPPQPGQTGFWYRFSHAIMRRPWLWFLGSLAVLLAMAIPVKDISLVGGTTGALPSEVEAVRGFEAMNESFGANRLTPIQIVITTPEEGGVFRPDFLDGVRRLSEAAAADPRNEEVR